MKLSTSAASSALGLQALFAGLAVAQVSGKFDVLTYNVAGLPAVINGNDEPGDKTTNARLIGAAMAKERFDIVHMQEDFNYHAYIYSTDTHPVRTPTSGGVPFGDGLNTLSNYNYTKFTRTTWKRCSLNSGDCLTPKGFSFMVIPTIGFELHLYNLHSDAGDSDSDVASRSSDVDQVLAAINAQSQGVPVIVAGDTNDRYTNAGVSITKFAQAGFKDPWVDLIKNGVYPAKGATADPCPNPALNNECEIVDKVLYRSGDSVTLTATSFNYVPQDFLQSNGSVLSDHNPVLVNFDWVKK